MQCKKCGTLCADDDVYCTRCGRHLPTADDNTVSASSPSISANQLLNKGGNFFRKIGHAIKNFFIRSRKAILICGCVIAAIFIYVGILFAYKWNLAQRVTHEKLDAYLESNEAEMLKVIYGIHHALYNEGDHVQQLYSSMEYYKNDWADRILLEHSISNWETLRAFLGAYVIENPSNYLFPLLNFKSSDIADEEVREFVKGELRYDKISSKSMPKYEDMEPYLRA